MKQMQEYTAEVFRRSAERIKKRKQTQKRILLCVTPVALCAVILTAAFLPELRHKNAPSNAQPEAIIGNSDGVTGNSADKNNGDFSRSLYVQVQIQSPSGNALITKKQAVDTIYAAILSAATVPPSAGAGNSSPSDDNFSPGDMGADPQYSATQQITITFTTKQGDQAVYTLSGSTLTEAASGNTVQLTDSQRKVLMDTLQLPG